MTEFAVPEPNTFPEQFCVKNAPELKVIPLASKAVSVSAAFENVIEPLMLPRAPVGRLMFNALVPLTMSCEPLATVKESAAVSPMVKVLAPLAWRLIIVLPETCNLPSVSVGTFTAVELPPWLKTRTSLLAGEVRLGDQLEGDVQSAESDVATHV